MTVEMGTEDLSACHRYFLKCVATFAVKTTGTRFEQARNREAVQRQEKRAQGKILTTVKQLSLRRFGNGARGSPPAIFSLLMGRKAFRLGTYTDCCYFHLFFGALHLREPDAHAFGSTREKPNEPP